jgi:hypothetical protein
MKPLSAAEVARSLRRAPVRRKGKRGRRPVLEEIGEPDVTFPEPPGTWREIPLGETDPARARWVELLLHDSGAARAERAEARAAYWRRRTQVLEARLKAAERWLRETSADPATPPAAVFEARVRRLVALADLESARARLRECEAALGAS